MATLDLSGLDILPYPVLIIDEGRFTFANFSALALTGYSAQQLYGMGLVNLLPPEFQAAVLTPIDRGRIVPKTDCLIITAGGEQRWVELSVVPFRGDLLVTLVDIHHRKQPDDTLNERIDNLQTIFDYLPVMLELWDADGSIKLVNREWERILGWTIDDARDSALLHGIYPDQQDYESVTSFMDAAQGVWEEFKTRTHRGSIIDTAWLNARLPDGSRISIGRDITERKQAEEALRRSEYLYRLLASNLPSGAVLLFDRDLVYTLADGPAIRDMGLTSESYIGKRLRDLFPPEIYERDEPMLYAALAGQSSKVEISTRAGDKIFLIQTLPVKDETGEIVGGMVLGEDITERKQAEEVLREQEQLKIALQKEQELHRLKTRMMERISHEFRTPLSIIMVSHDLLTRYYGRLDESQREEHLHKIRLQVEHLTEIIDVVTRILEGETRSLAFNPSLFDLRVLCEGIIARMRQRKLNRQFYFEAAGDLVNFYGDPDLLRRALQHLLSNAVKFSDDVSPISLLVNGGDNAVILRVKDHGVGITPEDQRRMFEPFYRGTNFGEVGGLGLGLSIVKYAVELHSGEVSLDSNPSEGTTVTIRLPRITPPDPDGSEGHTFYG